MVNRTNTMEISLPALKAGDRIEFAKLVEATSGPVYRLALKMVNDQQDAEDVLQETYIKAYRKLPEFEGRSSLSTWLYRITVNEALMLLRQRSPESLSIDAELETVDGNLEPMQIVDWCCLPEEELLSEEGRLAMDDAVQRLSPALRAVFVLRDIEGLSIRETAEALDLSETAVKTRLLRARLNLRNQLSTYYSERVAESKRP
jgi:RNA polymerase sigma-70 factor (ECF subfamily)